MFLVSGYIMSSKPYISMNNISKHFPGVVALDQVELTLGRGEVHCLAGQNGCGKSTLIKVISGVYQPEAGATIEFNGERCDRLTPLKAIELGVQVIWQDLSLFPSLTVAENISIQQHLSGSPFVAWKTIRECARKAIEWVGVDLDLSQKVEELSIADRQLVAICRAVAADARLVIMDEPTASLTRQEVKGLLNVVADLKAKGLSVIFVSHRLEEVMEVADRVTVIRDGKMVGCYEADELDDKKLAYLMTGQHFEFDLVEAYDKKIAPVLEVNHLSKQGYYQNVSLALHPGEILGLTGLLGSGRTELCLSLFGMIKPDSGNIMLDGEVVDLRNNRDAIAAGIGYVSEDRMSKGLVMDQSIHDNTLMSVMTRFMSKFGLLQHRSREAEVDSLIERLHIKVSDPKLAVKTLSGGNAQRIAISKWVAAAPRVLIMDAPTVGVDIANKEGIYSIARELAAQGVAILMVSDEVSEVFFNCHRVMVMKQGNIVAELNPRECSEKDIAEVVNNA